MNIKAKLPIIMEFESGDDYIVNHFIIRFEDITGIKLKKKNLDRGYGSSYTPWLLYIEKDKNYIKLLKKHIKDSAEC